MINDRPIIAELLSNMDNSPLGKLPAELRLNIYEFAFSHAAYIAPRFNYERRRPKLEIFRHPPRTIRGLRDVLCPLQVCKKMRDEVMGLQFGSESHYHNVQRSRRCLAQDHTILDNESEIFGSRDASCNHSTSTLHRLLQVSGNYDVDLNVVHKKNIHSSFQRGWKTGVLELAKAAFPTRLTISISVLFKRFGISNLT